MARLPPIQPVVNQFSATRGLFAAEYLARQPRGSSSATLAEVNAEIDELTESSFDAPLISVLLPTVNPWPAVSSALASLLSQTGAPSFEALVLDGHGAALSAAHPDPAVRWLRLPGKDSFALRAAGIAAARGAIIVVSEDHCTAPSDWLASIAAAHNADARSALVGVTVNHPDSRSSAMDRANFVLTFAGQNQSRGWPMERAMALVAGASFASAATGEALHPRSAGRGCGLQALLRRPVLPRHADPRQPHRPDTGRYQRCRYKPGASLTNWESELAHP